MVIIIITIIINIIIIISGVGENDIKEDNDDEFDGI